MAHMGNRPPNVILILADDLGYGDLGCYGNRAIRTPHLDRLAAGGLRFTDFHANAPVCSPTRAALLTGRYQPRAGIPGVIVSSPQRNRHHGLHTHEVTLSRCLKDAGYATGVFGKWHLGYEPRYNPVHHGFDRFRGYVSGNVDYRSHVDQAGFADWWDGLQLAPEQGYTTELITEHSCRFIEQYRDRPFFVYVAHEAPHYPYQGPDDLPDRTVGGDFPVWGSREDRKAAYREMIEAFDAGVGRVVETVAKAGLAEDTLIFFCSDNGANQVGSNAPLRGGKSTVWEGGHREPAIAYWPGRIREGRTTDETAMTFDLMPTCLTLAGAGVSAAHRLDGVDLGGVLFRGEALTERHLVWAFQGAWAVRRGRWKLVKGEKGCPGPALFDLAVDLGETTDLADAHPDRVVVLQSAYRSWAADVAEGATVQPERPA